MKFKGITRASEKEMEKGEGEGEGEGQLGVATCVGDRARSGNLPGERLYK